MGFLSFLRNKQVSAVPPVQAPPFKAPEANANATETVTSLLQVEQARRDASWHAAFYQCIQTAGFEGGEPAIITDAEGHSFFVLKTPAPGQPFEAICIRDSLNFLLEKGFGIAINPTDTYAEWLFSYGDMVNLHISNCFVTNTATADVRHIEMTKRVEVVKKGEDIMLAQPSDRYLPVQARVVIRKLLQQKGIRHPKTLLMCRKKGGHMIEELAFNVYPADFADTRQRDELMETIAWYLPSHYTVVSFREDTWMAKYFEPL